MTPPPSSSVTLDFLHPAIQTVSNSLKKEGWGRKANDLFDLRELNKAKPNNHKWYLQRLFSRKVEKEQRQVSKGTKFYLQLGPLQPKPNSLC